jgi:translation initiation factor IF-3
LIVPQLEDVANVETRPTMEARAMTLMVAPKPAVMQRVAQLKTQREKERQLAEKEGRTPPPPTESSLPNIDDDDDDDDNDD